MKNEVIELDEEEEEHLEDTRGGQGSPGEDNLVLG